MKKMILLVSLVLLTPMVFAATTSSKEKNAKEPMVQPKKNSNSASQSNGRDPGKQRMMDIDGSNLKAFKEGQRR